MFRNNMKILVNGEDVFQSRGSRVAIGATSNGYTLEFSVDGIVFTAYGETIPPAENLLIGESVSGLYFRLAGNTDQVVVRF